LLFLPQIINYKRNKLNFKIMKKFLLTLAVMVIAAGSVTAQDKVVKSDKAPIAKAQLVAQPKHECKDHKDGQPCTKPADQQCPDCKEAAKKN